MQMDTASASQGRDFEAMDRERLYDVIIRFRLRPIRRPVGRASVGWRAEDAARIRRSCFLPGDDALDRAGRAVIVIDSIGRVLFVNRTAEWLLEGPGALELSQAGFLRLRSADAQALLNEYLAANRGSDQGEARLGHPSLELQTPRSQAARNGQITVTPLFDPPLARLVQRAGPLHAVFVYESPPGTGLP